MKYGRSELRRLIDLAFQGLARDEALQAALQISPEEADALRKLLHSKRVMRGLEVLFNGIYPQAGRAQPPVFQMAENYPLEYLELSARAMNALQNSVYGELHTVADLLRLSDQDLTKIQGIGPSGKCLDEIRRKRHLFLETHIACTPAAEAKKKDIC